MIMGIGVDVTEFDRMRQAIDRHGQAFLDRILTPGEQAYCLRRRDPVPCIALRFAAKEAVAKAFTLGLGRMGLLNAEVFNEASGAPRLRFHGWLGAWLEEHAGVQAHLSLSDSENQAVAFVVIESTGATPLPVPPP